MQFGPHSTSRKLGGWHEWPRVYDDLVRLMSGQRTQYQLGTDSHDEALNAYLRGEIGFEEYEIQAKVVRR